MSADHNLLVIKTTITIADIEPPIWRRLLLPREINFAQLHEVIQAAFGWTDSHLHQFVVGGLVVGAPGGRPGPQNLGGNRDRPARSRLLLRAPSTHPVRI
jgi:hypothetical protein